LFVNLVEPLPAGATIYCIFDCCHSGTILDLRYCFNEKNYTFVENIHEEVTKPDVYLITGCMNVQTSADLPPGYINGLNKSIGALTGSLMPQLEQKLSWGSLITNTRKGLRKSHLDQIPQFEVGKVIDLKEYAFSKAFPSKIPQGSNANAVTKPSEPVPAFAISIKVHKNLKQQAFITMLGKLKIVQTAFMGLIAALDNDSKYKRVKDDMLSCISDADLDDFDAIRESIYVRLMHLMQYIQSDRPVLSAVLSFRDALMKDPSFREQLQTLRAKYPQFQQLMNSLTRVDF